MKRSALLAGAVLAFSVLTAPVALAGDDDLSCDEAKSAVTQAETRLENRAAKERVDEQKALKEAQAVVNEKKAALDDLPEGDADIPAARDALRDARVLRDAAKKALDTDSRRLADLRAAVTVAIQERDKACDEPEPTPTPEPTTPPAADQFDCDDFATQAAAQVELDKTLPEDPHKLDLDSDGVACEVDQGNPPAEDEDADVEDVNIDNDVDVVVPNGGVNTGAGPA